MISRTSKLLEIYDLHNRSMTLSKMAYSDNPEVACSYSFQIYALLKVKLIFKWYKFGNFFSGNPGNIKVHLHVSPISH